MKISFSLPALKNKTVLGICCIIIAALIGFVAVPLAARASDTSVAVVRSKTDIPAGTKINESMLEIVKMGKLNLPKNYLSQSSAAVGKYAAKDINADDIITSAKVADSGGIFDLADGQYLMSVTVKNIADALSGKLQSGDVVSVYFPPAAANAVTAEGADEAQCPPELLYVKVAAVTASNGSDTDVASVNKSSSDSSNNIPATVTLVVNDKQAAILATRENDTVHLVLAARGKDKGDKLLAKQAEYFKTVQASASSGATSSATSGTAKADADSTQNVTVTAGVTK